MIGIYEIRYKGKCVYIGSSIKIERRFSQHRYTLKRGVHRNFILQRMWDKNKDSFSFHLVKEARTQEELAKLEEFYINLLNPTTNISDAYGSHPHTEAARQKMRKPKTPEHLAKIRASALARRGRPNGRAGIPTNRIPSSAFKDGFTPWNKGKNGYSTSYKGTKLSKEHREKLSLAKLGKPKNEKARLALIGRKQSLETIAKRVAAFKVTIALRRTHASE